MAPMTCLIQCTVVGCDDRQLIYAVMMTSFSTYRLLDPESSSHRLYQGVLTAPGTCRDTGLNVLITLVA